MKHTKENIIKLIKAMIINKGKGQRIFKEVGNSEMAENLKKERWALEDILDLLTDKGYFEWAVKHYEAEIEEVNNMSFYNSNNKEI